MHVQGNDVGKGRNWVNQCQKQEGEELVSAGRD